MGIVITAWRERKKVGCFARGRNVIYFKSGRVGGAQEKLGKS